MQGRLASRVFFWGIATIICVFICMILVALNIFESGILKPEMYTQRTADFMLSWISLILLTMCSIVFITYIVKCVRA